LLFSLADQTLELSILPWEETEDYIRSGHRDSNDFQEGSFRTITIDADKGIKAVIGKPESKDTTRFRVIFLTRAKTGPKDKIIHA
jgi:hypothetical protein